MSNPIRDWLFRFTPNGWNAAPTTGKIIARIAPMLGVMPNPEAGGDTPRLAAH